MNALEKYAIVKLKSLANEVKELDLTKSDANLELQKALLRKEIYIHLLHHSSKQSDEE